MRQLLTFQSVSIDQNINMQAGVSNQVERVLEIYELKRTGVLYSYTKKLLK